MTWNYFIIFAIISVVCWIIGAIASWKENTDLCLYELRSCSLLLLYIINVDNA